MRVRRPVLAFLAAMCAGSASLAAEAEWWKPYSPPCTERENIFEFTEKPAVKLVGKDRYEITFAVKGYCDVTVAIVDMSKDVSGFGRGFVVRHLGSGVLGPNAPEPFQKNSLKQKLYWNGKDDLDEYVKDPGKLHVRVMLGLKPEFDKRLGGTSPHNIPGYVWGIAIGPDGAYVFGQGTSGHGHRTLRKFNLDGAYVGTLIPPPANLPESKLAGLSYVEYEPGKRALHGADITELSRDGYFFLASAETKFGAAACQPALAGGRLFFPTGQADFKKKLPALLLYIYTDGSTDVKGMKGRPLAMLDFAEPCFAASPDGKTLYLTTGPGFHKSSVSTPAVLRVSADGNDPAEPFVGNVRQPGSDNRRLNGPRGLDCDAQGRLYVCDTLNNRLQVFSPAGEWLKTIPVQSPQLVSVHKKTGSIYVLHSERVAGKTIGRLTKFKSFEQPEEDFHVDDFRALVMALDSWSPRPRLWTGGEAASHTVRDVVGYGPSVRIFEERDRTLVPIMDFDEEAKKEAGLGYFGRFPGGGSDDRNSKTLKSVIDPLRGWLYYRNKHIFDIKTGEYLGDFAVIDPLGYDDIAIDKRGYMHGHSWGTGPDARVWRVDPARARVLARGRETETGRPVFLFPEIPYDYGEERVLGRDNSSFRMFADGMLSDAMDKSSSVSGRDLPKVWRGALPAKSQASAHPWQHGLGVNMRGDVAVSSRITYIPKMDDLAKNIFDAGDPLGVASSGCYRPSYSQFMKMVQDVEKAGGMVYYLKREPGIPLAGDTIWTFSSTGELRHGGPAAILGGRLAGVGIDEDGYLYFSTFRSRMIHGQPFLKGKGGTFGAPEDASNRDPYLGTYIKSRPSGVRALLKNAPVPLDPPPARPPELWQGGPNWIEGAEWLYAGASPIVEGGCECPSSRPFLDWYKRSFVPEVYRHSIGILDTNGNLIMHLGRYGNFDSGEGARSRIPVGGDNIGVYHARFIGGSDDYLSFDCWGERLTLLRLVYHAEETARIPVE